MRPRIPRDMLWRNRETIEELLNEPLFKVLHEAFFYFEREPMLFPMDEMAILNEVGYQVTWLCYESRLGFEPDMEQLTREVFAHTGLKDHAMTVIFYHGDGSCDQFGVLKQGLLGKEMYLNEERINDKLHSGTDYCVQREKQPYCVL